MNQGDCVSCRILVTTCGSGEPIGNIREKFESLMRVLGSAGLGLLVLGVAYYIWSSDVASASALKSGKGIEIRATSGNVNIIGTQDNDVRVTIQNVSAESAKMAHIKIDRNRNPVLVEIKDLPQFATAYVEVPRAASLAVSMLAGGPPD